MSIMIMMPIQYAIVGIAGELHSEPWPAFVLPGFKNVYISDDNQFQIEQSTFIIEVDGHPDSVVLRPQELFPELPLSQVPGFMRTHFSNRVNVERLSEDARAYLYQQVKKVLGIDPLLIELVIEVEKYRFVDGKLILESANQLERLMITLQPVYFHEE